MQETHAMVILVLDMEFVLMDSVFVSHFTVAMSANTKVTL